MILAGLAVYGLPPFQFLVSTGYLQLSAHSHLLRRQYTYTWPAP